MTEYWKIVFVGMLTLFSPFEGTEYKKVDTENHLVKHCQFVNLTTVVRMLVQAIIVDIL